jgi:large exoprotein involved in heme utilization and adhesion
MTWGDGASGTVRVEGDDVRFIAGDGAHARAASITFGPGRGDGGNVEVAATRSFEMNGNGFLADWTHFVTATEGSGRGGNILIDAPAVSIDRGNLFARTRFGTGLAGSIRVDADTVVLRNEAGIGSLNEGPREGASVTIATRTLEAADTSFISADATGSGNAGRVRLTAQRARFTGASGITAASFGSGNAGEVVVDVSESLEMVERSVGTYQDLGGGGPRGAPVWPGGFSLSATGSGSAGSFHLRAPSIVLDDGRIRSTAEAAGDGGRVTIEAGTLVMRNGAQIDAKTSPDSTGAAGSMTIRVNGAFEISGRSPVDGAFSGLYAETQGSGRGGNIDVRADALTVDRAIIRSSTAGSGRAGSIRIEGGDIALTRGGWIDAGTAAASAGPGGDIEVKAARSLSLSGHDNVPLDSVTPPSGVRVSPATLGRQESGVASAISSNTSGAGIGGNVTLIAPRVSVADGAHISANSSGSAAAGSILVDSRPGSIVIRGGSITTQAGSSDGGNITLMAGNRVHIRNGEISTSVGAGAGSGGNIFIDPTFVILERARIAANAFGGSGGNIDVVTGYFLASSDSRLEASSQLGVAGNVQVSAVQSEVVSELPALPAQFFDASGVLREACTPRAAGSSRLVDVGRGGIQAATLGYSASRYFDDSPAPASQALVPTSTAAARGQSVLLAGICGS